METRLFGRTGERFSILSFGAQRIVDGHKCSEAEAIRMVNYALDHGIRYFDTARVYSDGQSEERVGKVAKHRRQEMWIATKTRGRTRAEAMVHLEESLGSAPNGSRGRMADAQYLEHGGTGQADRARRGPGGRASCAREQGKVRYISMSGHRNPQVQVEALNRFPFDSMLVALSALDHFILSFRRGVPAGRRMRKGVAVIGMKVMALAKLGPYYERALRYTMGLPISTTIVGMESMDQLQGTWPWRRSSRPSATWRSWSSTRRSSIWPPPQVMRWKTTDYFNPVEWEKR